MKQHPPPPYTAAMTANQINPNMNESQSVQSRATTHFAVATTAENGDHCVPPTENNLPDVEQQ